MKVLTVRLPDGLVAQIDAEAKARNESGAAVVRHRLQGRVAVAERKTVEFDAIADLIGSVDGLPGDLASRKKHYLSTSNRRFSPGVFPRLRQEEPRGTG